MEVVPEGVLNASDRGTPVVRAAKDIVFGSIAGIASKFIEHPFDLTKVRLQAQVLDAEARFSGPLDCLTRTYRNEGLRGLYRGLPAPVVGAMAENATLFLAYSELQSLIRKAFGTPPTEPLSVSQLALSGAGAGSITSFVLTPIELVKCKMQVQMLVGAPASGPAAALHATSLPGPAGVLRDILRESGIRGLWLGQTATLIRETGGSAAWFATKEAVAALLLMRRGEKSGGNLQAWESAVSGACAGAAFNLAFFPADTIKSTMQTEEELRPELKVPGRQRGFLTVGRELWRAQGLKGLYAGCGITIARSVPSSAIIFLIYDGLRKRFG
ncbi:mitochondrial carrier domain-containing protein [Vararia minispora EC-137]|uniref:Mitochondrial carrier domain-containing protein n=1 Tax=Vararia minispora EC-137 TaxID=1314806 RepID=A0ACB8QLA8_9AGAM|nr:mitochondrial carrier domain-containing protein [Vararia minispora EC-137]